MSNPTMAFLMLAGTPTADGASYAGIPFQWVYSRVGQASGHTPTRITVTYPGWITKNLNGMPMGSYMSQSDFSSQIKLTFGQLIDKLATEDVTLQTCPMGPSGGVLDVKGTIGLHGQRWYWEIFCAGHGQTLLTFDAASGSPMQ